MWGEIMRCEICGKEQPSKFYFEEPGICLDCAKNSSFEDLERQRARNSEEEAQYLSIIVTTSHSIDGHHVSQYLDVITAECVFGMNIFKDIFAGVRDVFGGRSESVQNVMKEARKLCLQELRKEAFTRGADAVVGVDLDYSEISGGGKSMLFLVASGTAVKLEKTKPSGQ